MEKAGKASFLWSLSTAIKKGYLIKFHRGFLKVPKMQYFVLMPTGLVWFNYKPDKDAVPIGNLPLKHLTSIKVNEIELNSCMLSCMEIMSKTTSHCLLAFSRKEERNEWMRAMMTAFAEALVSTKSHSQFEEVKPRLYEGVVTAAVTQLHGIVTHLSQGQETSKHRKRNRQSSLRRTKSQDLVGRYDCTKESKNENLDKEDCIALYEPSRKRKSEPDIYKVLPDFPLSWTSNCEEFAKAEEQNIKIFRTNCFDHRDSFDLIASRQCLKCDDLKSNIITKIISKFELSTRLIHFKS